MSRRISPRNSLGPKATITRSRDSRRFSMPSTLPSSKTLVAPLLPPPVPPPRPESVLRSHTGAGSRARKYPRRGADGAGHQPKARSHRGDGLSPRSLIVGLLISPLLLPG